MLSGVMDTLAWRCHGDRMSGRNGKVGKVGRRGIVYKYSVRETHDVNNHVVMYKR